MNRKYLLTLPFALLLFTLILTACGGGEDFTPPDQPNLSLQAGEQSDGGLRTVACWPKGEKNVSCEFTNDTASPSTALTVQGGQAVIVAIANPEGVALPNQVVIASRETDAAGAPLFTMQIDPAQTTEFVLALPNGRYLLDVTAYYADIEGSSATVSNVFAVDVGQAVAVNPTPEATDAATLEATPEVTDVATEAATPEATEATPEATEEATVEATPEATEATPEATEETGTSGGSETETPAATEETVEPTAEATEPVATAEAATPEATESVTTPEPTEAVTTPEATELVTETPVTPTAPVATTPAATEEAAAPTETPTEVATEAPTATPTEEVTEVAAPPTNTATPTPSPTTPVAPTATLAVDAPPAVALRVSGRNYQPVGYDYCRPNASNELECVKQPFTSTGTTTIRAARNAAANIRIDGSRPTSIEINYLSRDTLQPIASETRVGDNVVLFNLGVAAGSYILSVEIIWPDDVSVTYYFQLQVLQ